VVRCTTFSGQVAGSNPVWTFFFLHYLWCTIMSSTSVWLVCPETHELWFYTAIMSRQLPPVLRVCTLMTRPSHRTCKSMVRTQFQEMGGSDHSPHVHGPANHDCCPLAIILLNLGIFSPLRHKLVFLRSPALTVCLLALWWWCPVSTEWNNVFRSLSWSLFVGICFIAKIFNRVDVFVVLP